MNVLEYKNYIAEVTFSAEDDTFIGEVANIRRDKILFSGNNPRELRKHFKEVMDAYLADGNMAEEPYSGRITVRTSPQEHAAFAKAALLSGKRSFNAWIEDTLKAASAQILEHRPGH